MTRKTYLSALAVLFLVTVLAGFVSVTTELAHGSVRVLQVSGIVRDAATSRTVRGADVRLNFVGMDLLHTETDGGGRYLLRFEVPDVPTLPSGRYEVHANDTRYCGSLPAGFTLSGVQRTAVLQMDLSLRLCPE